MSLKSNMKNLTDREKDGDILFLGTAQDNESDTSNTTEAESLVCYVLSNFHCGTFNGELRNASEVFKTVDEWLQEKDRSGYMRAKSEVKNEQ